MDELRFIHTADLHLGRPFSGLTRSSPELGKLVGNAAYTAWSRLVQAAVDLQVDFITIAGDVFDNGSPTVRARVAFRDGVLRLHEAGIRVFLALGNHDPLSDFPAMLRSTAGLEVFGGLPEVKQFRSASFGPSVGIHGLSFPKAAIRDNLVTRIRRDPQADFAIGVIHANVAGVPGHDDYAPCSLDDLRASGMDVWCLGHVHKRLVLSSDPLILYPGTLQGAHINETGPHGCVIITVDPSGHASHKFLQVAPVRWEHRDVDVSGFTAAEDVFDSMEEACRELVEQQDGLDAYVVRFNLTGRTGPSIVEFGLLDGEGWETLSERLASLSIPVFAASVRDFTRPPVYGEAMLGQEGFLGEFAELCRRLAANPASANEIIQTVMAELAKMRLRRFVDGELDLRRVHEEPAIAADLFRLVEETVVKRFCNAAEDKH